MAVPLSTAQRNALREGPLALFGCADLFLDAGTQSFWDGWEDKTIGARDYVAIGGYASTSPVAMGADLGSQGIELTLDASRLLADAADETDPSYFLSTIIADGGYRQRRMELAYSLWNADDGEHILNLRRFTGVIDQMQVREGPGDDSIGRAHLAVKCESLTLRYGLRIGRVRSHEDQQEIWPEDDFFKFCAGSVAQERELVWGRANSTVSGGSSGGGGAPAPGNKAPRYYTGPGA